MGAPPGDGRRVRIELFGIARARAGTEAVEVNAATVAAALRGLVEKCPGVVPEVVADGRLTAGFLASVNGEHFVTDDDEALGAEDTLLILGAQAGG